jgi:hypothetical protein
MKVEHTREPAPLGRRRRRRRRKRGRGWWRRLYRYT